MQISPQQLRKLQLTQLGIAVEVAALCDKHGLSYVLLGGSALGARRHGGFIPWDDDMDMGMLRHDFDRFLDVARRELPTSFYVQYWLDDPHMGAPFAKVRLNDTRLVEESSKGTGGHKGIAIDIFPFDNVPNGLVEYPWKLLLMFWKRLLRHKSGYTMRALPLLRRLADLPMRIAARHISKENAKQRFRSLMSRYNDETTDRVLAVGGAYDFSKDMLKRSWLTDRCRQQFEDRSFYCPADLNGYLEHMYGNYMCLPPVEDRRTNHTILDLVFPSDEGNCASDGQAAVPARRAMAVEK